MNKNILNQLNLSLIIVITSIALLFYNHVLYISGRGVQEENNITFGLIELIDERRVHYYEVNIIIFYFLIILILVSYYILYKRFEIKDTFFNAFYIILMLSIVSLLIDLIFNFDYIEEVYEYEGYSREYFKFLDDLFPKKGKIKVKLNVASYKLGFYSIITTLISTLVLSIRILILRRKNHQLLKI